MTKKPERRPPPDDQTTWKVFTVTALILGAVFAWQAIKGTSPAAPKPADMAPAAAAPAASAPASKGPVVVGRGKAKNGKDLPPDFRMPEIFSGKEIKLSGYEGGVVLVDFWATWCGPCRMEIPNFVELQEAYRSKGFSIVGVSLDQQGDEVVKNFATQWKINYAMVHDQNGEIGAAYGGIRSIPTTLLIGKDGTVKELFVGYREKEVFEKAIKKALAEASAPAPKKKA